MSKSLFRPEVLQTLQHPQYGETLPGLPGALKFCALGACVTFAGLAVLLWQGYYTRRITVTGYVTAAQSEVRVFSRNAGIITERFVSNGDIVNAGDPLFNLALDGGGAGFGQVSDSTLDSIGLQLATVDRQRAARVELHTTRMDRLAGERNSARERVSLLRQRVAAAEQKLAIAEIQHNRVVATVARGFLASVETERSNEALLAEQGLVMTLGLELAQARAAITKLQNERSETVKTHELALAELASHRQSVETQFVERRKRLFQSVIAPVGGRVSTASAGPGQRIGPELPAMTIVPTAVQYHVRLLLPGRALGFVAVGGLVRIRYEAFPYQRFGIQSGVIEQISPSYVLPRELDSPITVTEAVFPIKVALGKQSLQFNGQDFALTSGMRVEADIPKERRRLLEWLFEPLLGVIKRQ